MRKEETLIYMTIFPYIYNKMEDYYVQDSQEM
jgi:hypothetical protein